MRSSNSNVDFTSHRFHFAVWLIAGSATILAAVDASGQSSRGGGGGQQAGGGAQAGGLLGGAGLQSGAFNTGTGTATATGTGDAFSLLPEAGVDAGPTMDDISVLDRSGAVGAAVSTGVGVAGAASGQGTQSRGRGLGGGRGIGGLGGLGGLGGRFGNAFGGGAQATQQQSAIRTRLRSAVDVAPLPQATVQQRASRRFRDLPAGSRIPGVRVQMDGRTAILSGTVRSAKDRRMSELLMRLEPGVSRIDNRLRLQQ